MEDRGWNLAQVFAIDPSVVVNPKVAPRDRFSVRGKKSVVIGLEVGANTKPEDVLPENVQRIPLGRRSDPLLDHAVNDFMAICAV
ncbi:MAG TPA: hypothetical protein VJ837_04735 [Candidatus Paceibacterota bacterium]|nr:hypothetical protein [Candidatus Paceibacterota bacterium]